MAESEQDLLDQLRKVPLGDYQTQLDDERNEPDSRVCRACPRRIVLYSYLIQRSIQPRLHLCPHLTAQVDGRRDRRYHAGKRVREPRLTH